MITNASPLIIFAKIQKLDLLRAVVKEITTPYAVYEEVVLNGKDASDALLLKEYVEKRMITVITLSKEAKEKAEQLEKTYKNKEKYALIDEKNARDVAKLQGIVPKGSLYVLIRAFQEKRIDEKELRRIVMMMTTTKFHL